MPSPDPSQLDFSGRHNHGHDLHEHRDSLVRRLSNWRDMQMARKALKRAGDPALVLDLSCGSGRFWPLLAEQPNRVILAVDSSMDMLAMALGKHPAEVVARVNVLQTSAFAIDLGDNAVDCIFCMRLLHQLALPEQRLALLRECQRVTRDTLIVSLWVGGNYQAWHCQRVERRRTAVQRDEENQCRFIVDKQQITSEFRQAGLDILDHWDVLPGYAMRRVYTLRKKEGSQ